MKMKYRALIILFLLLFCNLWTKAQVAVDTVSTVSGESKLLTFSHTVSGTYRLLIVGISLEAGASEKRVTNVTYNGVDLTRVGESVSSGGDPRADVWKLVDPPTGANNVVVTLHKNNKCRVGAISFTNVKQSNPICGIILGEGSSGNPSIVVTSTSDYLVMDVVASLASELTVGEGQTPEWIGDMGGSQKRTGASTEAGTSSVRMSWKGREKWAGVAFNILPEVPLPVELTSFVASNKNNTVVLNWHTVTEVNNYGFEVERSLTPTLSRREGAFNWEKIGFVNGHGNSNSPKDYSFIDKKVLSGKYSYRLKQIDSDGKYEYSKEVEVTINNIPTKFELKQNYPNPFNPSTKISWQSPVSSWQTLKIYNVLGNEVATLVDEEKEAGYHSIDFNASDLPSGVYFYIIQSGNFISTRKMLLLK